MMSVPVTDGYCRARKIGWYISLPMLLAGGEMEDNQLFYVGPANKLSFDLSALIATPIFFFSIFSCQTKHATKGANFVERIIIFSFLSRHDIYWEKMIIVPSAWCLLLPRRCDRSGAVWLLDPDTDAACLHGLRLSPFVEV